MSEQTRQVVTRRVTYNQLEMLWEALNSHRELALGFNKTAQAREQSRRMWEDIAQTLNSQGDGAVKDWKGWSKYWNDYKSKLKKLSAATARSHRQTGGGPSTVKPMSEIEKKILIIMGNNYGLGLAGARVEPFLGEPEAQTASDAGSESILISNLQPVRAFTEPEPGPSWRMTDAPDTQNERGIDMPLSPPLQPSPTSIPMDLPTPAPATPPQRVEQRTIRESTPRGSPRRRRRREPPMSAEAARRILVREVQRRAEYDQRNSQLFQQLVNEIREIKQLISRATGTPTDVEQADGVQPHLPAD